MQEIRKRINILHDMNMAAEGATMASCSPDHAATDSARKAAGIIKSLPKIPRACDFCHSQKVRCLPSTSSTMQRPQCQRCESSSRDCVFSEPSKIRHQRRTDLRVRELEKRIESLAALLGESRGDSASCVGNENTTTETALGQDQQHGATVFATTYGSSRLDAASSSPKTTSTATNPRWLSPPIRTLSIGQSMIAAIPQNDEQSSTKRFTGQTSRTKGNSSRRSHKKSRTGCEACKRRKIKCDETRPRCNNCAGRLFVCQYQTPNSASEISQTSNTTSPCALVGISSMRLTVATSPLEKTLGDHLNGQQPPRVKSPSGMSPILEALSHFERVAFHTVGAPHMQLSWQKHGLHLAQEAPFLFPAICAYSAHHLYYLDPAQRRFKASAAYHRQRGLELYRRELSQPVTSENMDAVFGACMLFAMLAYSSDDPSKLLRPENSFLFSDDASAISWLAVQSGFMTLKRMANVRPYLRRSIWSPLFAESDEQGFSYDMRAGVDGVPAPWVELCGLDEHSTDENNPYHAALRLCLSIMRIDVSVRTFTWFISFPGRMRQDFFELMRRKDPVALLIVAYWLSRMCLLDQWWCMDRVRNECRAICAYLDACDDERIRTLLRVPMEACV